MDYMSEIKKLQLALSYLQDADEDISVEMVDVFLMVACEPGIAFGEVRKVTGLAQSTLSRHVSALGDYKRNRDHGAGLIESVEDPNERRRKRLFLTAKGRRVVSHICAAQLGAKVSDVELDIQTSKQYLKSARKPVSS